MAKSIQLNFSKELYTSSVCHFIGTLSPKSKYFLSEPEEKRVGGAFLDLLSELENIEFFCKFSNATKELLAKKLKYVAHQGNEILLKQGVENDPPQALYIIISGMVVERYKPVVRDTDDFPVLWPEKMLRKGDCFGHVDIAYKRPPTVDAQTVGYVELLKLSKEDFHIVQKEMEAHCTRINHYLRITEAIVRFDWLEEEYKVLQIYSKLSTFAKNQNIYPGVGNKKPFWSYFIVLGACKIVRELTYYVSGSGQLKAIPHQLINELKLEKTIKDCIEFEEVKQGFYFGVGENFFGNHIIADHTLECLLIPRRLLVFKNRQLLRKMAKDLTDSLPSDQEVLDSYSKLISESKTKTEMFQEMFKDKQEMLI